MSERIKKLDFRTNIEDDNTEAWLEELTVKLNEVIDRLNEHQS